MNNFKPLQQYLDTFYETYHIPIFHLNEQYQILRQPTTLSQINPDFLPSILPSAFLLKGKVDIVVHYQFLYILIQDDTSYYGIGPLTVSTLRSNKFPYATFFANYQHASPYIQQHLSSFQLPPFSLEALSNIRMLYQFLKNEDFTVEELKTMLHTDFKKIEEQLISEWIITKRDDQQQTYPYLEERQFLNYIQAGDSMQARFLFPQILKHSETRRGEDALRDLRYKILSMITLMTHAVIHVGVDVENAYGTSEIYRKGIDHIYTQPLLIDHFMNAIIDFCALVKRSQKMNYPHWVYQCMEYINQNLHKQITLQAISNHVHLSESYVSTQFKKLTTTTLKEYINKQKVMESLFLLESTQMNILDISITLNFSSQSYFTKVFKEYMGTLPSEYLETKRRVPRSS